MKRLFDAFDEHGRGQLTVADILEGLQRNPKFRFLLGAHIAAIEQLLRTMDSGHVLEGHEFCALVNSEEESSEA